MSSKCRGPRKGNRVEDNLDRFVVIEYYTKWFKGYKEDTYPL